MDQHNHDDGSPKKPPDGLIAGDVLAVEKKDASAEPAERDLAQTKNPAALPADPNYAEPWSPAAYQKVADDVFLGGKDDPGRAMIQLRELVKFLITRVQNLEEAVKPFAVAATMMSNARMCLIAENRPTEPAGGVWLSNVQGITLQPNEGLFFNAWDSYGRQRTHDHVCAVFLKMQEARKLQEEKDKHVEDGGSIQ